MGSDPERWVHEWSPLWCETTRAPSTLPPSRKLRVFSGFASDAMTMFRVKSVSVRYIAMPWTTVVKNGSANTLDVDSG